MIMVCCLQYASMFVLAPLCLQSDFLRPFVRPLLFQCLDKLVTHLLSRDFPFWQSKSHFSFVSFRKISAAVPGAVWWCNILCSYSLMSLKCCICNMYKHAPRHLAHTSTCLSMHRCWLSCFGTHSQVVYLTW